MRAPFAEEVYDLPTNSLPFGHIRTKAKRANDYLMNWEIHKLKRFGIAGVNLQDVCVTENEGPTPILDRSKENLCFGDLSVIKARRMLLDAAQALRQRGAVPVCARDASVYRVRGCSATVREDVDWIEGVRESVTVPPPSE